ncbi:hypothetical protein [Brevibacillus porteri]|uniref:Uncharacterized protein n=1 Tax=Brevibacillus porteri TaxID=2126350 RepID=A0ABX5FS82_9BACL|nr:hypothetical protein [Brevibacillus porteri]MED1801821.1 hypothetical protein [Brevibacillus porteri]MED2134952.1 hypothetical protein [Brevibacillus porteri]MED2745474.1 hypothetical protein [Brevibacillus porteri]MED2815780.1 hypothetical protein [Brevibacillus porteri]MED2897618.1 hypothetical protein [Brevibacillus porteri]
MDTADQIVQQHSPVFALADQLVALRERKEQLKAQTENNNAEIERTERELLEQMQENDLQNFKRSGKQFICSTKVWASAVDKDKVYDWMKNNGYGDLVKETVNANSFNSLVKELLDQDGFVPEEVADVINVTERATIIVRKG